VLQGAASAPGCELAPGSDSGWRRIFDFLRRELIKLTAPAHEFRANQLMGQRSIDEGHLAVDAGYTTALMAEGSNLQFNRLSG
jgi:hypothetical protein|tara:strand:- start:12348 stop:12596 length:249 start_codon:yes stop_codon:yes gene_type:complete